MTKQRHCVLCYERPPCDPSETVGHSIIVTQTRGVAGYLQAGHTCCRASAVLLIVVGDQCQICSAAPSLSMSHRVQGRNLIHLPTDQPNDQPTLKRQ